MRVKEFFGAYIKIDFYSDRPQSGVSKAGDNEGKNKSIFKRIANIYNVFLFQKLNYETY